MYVQTTIHPRGTMALTDSNDPKRPLPLGRNEIIHHLKYSQESMHRRWTYEYSALHPMKWEPAVDQFDHLSLPPMNIAQASNCWNKTALIYICSTKGYRFTNILHRLVQQQSMCQSQVLPPISKVRRPCAISRICPGSLSG